MKAETVQRIARPTGILIGLSDELAALCAQVLAEGGLQILRVGHVAAACERIPVTMPQLVVVASSLHPAEVDMLTDRCVAVGAEILHISPSDSPQVLRPILQKAADQALIAIFRRGG